MMTRPSWSTMPNRSPSASVAMPKSQFVLRTSADELGQVLFGAGGGDPAEVGVDVAVDLLDRDAVLLEDLVEVFAARAVEQVHADLHARPGG